MKYRFILTYQATDSETTYTRTCFPLHGDDLSISIDRAEGEWYYTRNLDGKLVFERDDYDWIMGQEFDGTFTLNIKESHDNGATFYDYFTGTFSRASLEIDQDNHKATLNGLKEGVEDLIKNGKNEDYDLMKLIPDSYAKEVQGQVPPALAMVDYNSDNIQNSDVFCGGPAKGNGYKEGKNDWTDRVNEQSNDSWYFKGVYAEAKVTMNDHTSEAEGIYKGELNYRSTSYSGHTLTSVEGWLTNENNCQINIVSSISSANYIYIYVYLFGSGGSQITGAVYDVTGDNNTGYYNPSSLSFDDFGTDPVEKINIFFHYIRATLLTQFADGVQENVLDTGDYYKGMAAFNNNDGGLVIEITANTSDQPNGHRMVPGTDEYGGTPQYFAPPDTEHDWIPLAEDNWNYASMWYTIQPSVANGLTDPAKIGTFRWTRCWTIGCCIMHLLKRITNDKVVFAESTSYSEFLYGNPNPLGLFVYTNTGNIHILEGNEPFQWLVTQKSNVMRPAAGGASRCIVRLDWFFELLRNAFNCYYWFERRNDGRYDFRIEHVEYFRRGGAYNCDLADQLDLTILKPVRNFLRNGQPAKRYADQTNRYTFDLDGMVEKYTYSWQGDGGGDDFKGNPMYFKAGWIEKGSSDDRQVDNIFADLGWLMLNAGTATESSKNYDGLFIFGGYQPLNTSTSSWKENTPNSSRYWTLAVATIFNHYVEVNVTLTVSVLHPRNITVKLSGIPIGGTAVDISSVGITLQGSNQTIVISTTLDMADYSGYQRLILELDFGNNWSDFVINRVHSNTGNIYRVPNVENMLHRNSYLQNGVLAWPWLQCEYLHYDIPAAKWTYLKDDYTDGQTIVWKETGTIKMVKKQTMGVVPVPDASTEDAIVDIMGVKTGLGIGIIDNAKINLSSRNAEMTIIYDINPQNQ